MAKKKKEKEETVVKEIHVAKRHQVLQDISEQVRGIEVKDSFEVLGHDFYMTTLDADEEVWADGYMNVQSHVSAYTSLRVPKLAASIKRIDGIHVEELFDFSEDSTKEDISYHNETQYRRRYWTMNQLLVCLGERPNDMITELWSKYTELTKRKSEAWDELKNSSAGTPGGESKASSSPEKASSQAAPM